jgi:hypothetical protein
MHDLKEHLSGMARDLGRIAELQLRLAAADWRQSRGALLRAAACWLTAWLLSAAVLPVALAALGLWLADATALSAAGGLACVAGAVAAIASALVLVGWLQLRKQFIEWQRSKQELHDNIEALRRAFTQRLSPEQTLP